jgi:ubiquinone/menaquinone biosynthesis C-methylase UbiE
MTSYDDFAQHYDGWAPADVDDVDFYVEQARASGGPVVELGVGTGRVAIPTARASVRVIGIDASEEMLEICRRRAEEAGVAHLVELRQGDFRSPPVSETVPLVTCPFRSLLHLETDDDRRTALAAIRRMLQPKGRFVFDVVAPRQELAPASDTDWIERAPGVWENAEVDWAQQVIEVRVRSGARETRLRLTWLTREEWLQLFEESGFGVHACYGWFDLRPCGAGVHSVWVVERPD